MEGASDKKAVTAIQGEQYQERKGFIKHDGVKLFFSLHGKGEPTIVFIHGLTSSSKVWNCQTDVFCKTNQTLAIDLRGFGKSDKLVGPYSLDLFADDLNFMLKKLTIKKPVVVGQGFGGMVAMNFALCYPNNISKLVLVASTPKLFGPTEQFPFSLTEQQLNQLIHSLSTEQGRIKLVNETFISETCPNKSTLGPIKERLLESFRDIDLDVLKTIAKQAGGQSLIPELSKIKVPTLIVVGTHDRISSAQSSVFLRRFIPNSYINELHGKGRLSFITDAKRFNRILRDFITEKDLLCTACSKK